MIIRNNPANTEGWYQDRAGVITASTFAEAVSITDGLTKQQQVYVDAIKAGKTEAEARVLADYKKAPSAEGVERALKGMTVGRPSDPSIRLAIRTALEQIIGRPYGKNSGGFYATERGHTEEEYARMRYQARNEVIVDEAGLVLTDDCLFGASLDGLINDDGTMEVKTPLDLLKVINIIQTGDLSEYMHQMQGGLWITGRQWCDFCLAVPDLECLNNGNELYVQRVYRDDNFIETMEQQLWAHAVRVKKYKEILLQPYSKAANDAMAMLAEAA
jgi:hypothetical protein